MSYSSPGAGQPAKTPTSGAPSDSLTTPRPSRRVAPVSKLSLVKAALVASDGRKALAIAAKFPRLGDHKERIERGHAAATHPDFYREIGKNPDALIVDGVAALRERLGL